MEIQEKVNLKAHNTFGINAKASQFIEIHSIEEAQALFQSPVFKEKKHLFLGGGSNVLLSQDFDGLVVKNQILGIEVREEGDDVFLSVGAGENWHELVMFCVDHSYAGLENLSLIPGSVGASPMQNIGAYGVEVKDSITEVEAIEIKSGQRVQFSNAECQFDYRSSIFKTSHRNRYFIVGVQFKLSKTPKFKTSYGAIKEELSRLGISDDNLSIKAISQAVINIRQSKLPDPKEIGNSGSFFKNPIVDKEQYAMLQKEYPEIPGYEQNNGSVKLAAGWLIEKAGWKGFKRGNYGVHEKQALVLVNYGGASGEEILQLSEEILQDVAAKFQVRLEREVNII